jgi:hypothetical protein
MNNSYQVPYKEIIQFFIDKFKYQSYLELGIRDSNNTFNHINCKIKEGVDINNECLPTYCMTTNKFFETVGKNKTWDIIFIDASHEKNQVLRDFDNALARLNENGTIIMDDINPTEPFLLSPIFCDNAWEAFAELGKRSDIQMHAITPSYFGFVRKGQQTPHSLEIQPTFEFLNQHREEIVRPITWDELLIMFK